MCLGKRSFLCGLPSGASEPESISAADSVPSTCATCRVSSSPRAPKSLLVVADARPGQGAVGANRENLEAKPLAPARLAQLDNGSGADYLGLGNMSNARCDCPSRDSEMPGLLRLFPLPSLAKLSIDQELDRHIHEQ